MIETHKRKINTHTQRDRQTDRETDKVNKYCSATTTLADKH